MLSPLSEPFIPRAAATEECCRLRGAQAHVLRLTLASLGTPTDVDAVLVLHNEAAVRQKASRRERSVIARTEDVLAFAARKARREGSGWTVVGRRVGYTPAPLRRWNFMEGAWGDVEGLRIGGYLGHGHCGIVCALGDDKRWCVKLVRLRVVPTPPRHLATESLTEERFLAHLEAQAVAADLGLTVPPLASGTCEWRSGVDTVPYAYLVMPRLRGCTLARWMERTATAALDVAPHVVTAVRAMLAPLDGASVQRALRLLRDWDPKPSNVWVVSGNDVRDLATARLVLLDFEGTNGPPWAPCCDDTNEETLLSWIARCVAAPVSQSRAWEGPPRVVDGGKSIGSSAR
jgi:hypothetical protein